MAPISVLIVDDLVITRQVLSRIISEDPDFVVAGTAPDGRLAIEKLRQLSVDAVVLDIEMPEMDGLATLRVMRKTHPNLPILVFSSHTEQGAEVTIDSLLLGATDYVTKPAGTRSVAEAEAYIRKELLAKLRECTRSVRKSVSSVAASTSESRSVVKAELAPRIEHEIHAVAIGASTGGPAAVSCVVQGLPAHLSVPVFITQHMPTPFTEIFARRLNLSSTVRVRECRGRSRVEEAQVWIAPGDRHMIVEKTDSGIYVLPHEGPPDCFCIPSVNVLFRSMATVYGANALGVVLTGMGQDGTRGAEAIFEAGGELIVQSADSCVVPTMAMSVLQAGFASEAVSIEKMADAILSRLRKSKIPSRASAGIPGQALKARSMAQ